MPEQNVTQKAKKAKVTKPIAGTLVKANVITNRKPGYMYFVGKDNGLYELKMQGKYNLGKKKTVAVRSAQ